MDSSSNLNPTTTSPPLRKGGQGGAGDLSRPLPRQVNWHRIESGISPPSLLVSVRNAAEAAAALAGGCDILDVKDPARGSLGRADVVDIAAIVAERDRLAPFIPVSVALGEAVETGASPPEVLPGGISFCKLGTAGLRGNLSWIRDFRQAMTNWEPKPAVEPDGGSPDWVAVAYADCELARSPEPSEVVRAAVECGCRGVLIDTYSKSGPGLFDCLSRAALRNLARLARDSGLWFALAGRLALTDVEGLGGVAPDVVGIRSAACRHGLRVGEIDPQAIREFRAALDGLVAVAT